MNVSTLSTGSALSRTLPEGREGGDTLGQIGVVPRFDGAAARSTREEAGMRPVSGNAIGAPLQGGKMEAPRGLAADRMEQVQADIPEDAMSGLMALLMKFQKMQEVAR